jgi:outer membrane receptor for ferrienterochelin and colicin
MKNFFVRALSMVVMTISATLLPAQGVTTGSIAGRVTSSQSGESMQGARVRAVHLPSGTNYQALVRPDGRYIIPSTRVGGPYTVTVNRIGFAPKSQENVSVQLGVTSDVSFVLTAAAATQLSAVTVTAVSGGQLSSSRSGAATTVSRDALEALPTITRSINDFTRLTPQASGTSFAGQDNRLNNITVDGSYFNNSFGLGSQPGARTNVSPIPLDAIDQVQVNVAPFDVRQGGFTGAGVNVVTKSGTNTFAGSVYRLSRSQDFVGEKVGNLPFNPGSFTFSQFGARLGGPIIKNKLFFFVNYETDGLEQPGSTFRTNTGTETVTGNVTRVLDSDATALSSFLRTNFGYETGATAGYQFKRPSDRVIGKVDFNANDNNKLSLRYSFLNSSNDVLASNSNAIGFGNRTNNANSISYDNSNYAILENIRSTVGEWNSQITSNLSNNMIIGYTSNDESRKPRGATFPVVDILNAGLTYLSFGSEAFTPANQLRYNTFQFQNNLSLSLDKHDITFGVTAQRYRSENVFFPGSQSAYVYNSLADFYADANDFKINPNRTTSPITLNRFQLRYNNIPGQAEPLQPLDVTYAGVYLQDEFRIDPRFKLTLGMRIDVPSFKNTALNNPAVPGFTFRDDIGAPVSFSTSALPGKNVLYSPRMGFNWNARGDRSTQVRGGSGIFTGSPPYVWISNQLGQNGIITGFDEIISTTAAPLRNRPFNPNPLAYAPTTVTGAPAASYELNFTQPGYKFPQVWRSNIAVDQKLGRGFVATLEYLYNQDVNGAYYYNANLPVPTRFNGPDARPRYASGNRLVPNVTSAFVLANQDVGSSYSVAASIEKAFVGGFFAKAAYSYGSSRNTIDPGSTASGTFNGNQIAGDPNNPGTGFSSGWAGHRAFGVLSYKKRYFGFGETGMSLFAELRSLGNTSYVVGGDLNGDGGTANDLVYIPLNQSEMNFEAFTVAATATTPARTFTVAEQVTAWDAYIKQDKYLSSRRGQYAERGALFLPTVFRADFSVTQDIFKNIGGQRNSLQLRADIQNVGNLLNKNWGGAQRVISNQPLVARPTPTTGATAGVPLYRFRNIGTSLLDQTFQRTTDINDVWRMQIGLRYTFN